MEKIDILLWIVGVGFTFVFGLMLTMWSHLTSSLKEVKTELGEKINKLDEKVTDIDRRLCRLEGAFTAKECCRIQDERQLKKAE